MLPGPGIGRESIKRSQKMEDMSSKKAKSRKNPDGWKEINTTEKNDSSVPAPINQKCKGSTKEYSTKSSRDHLVPENGESERLHNYATKLDQSIKGGASNDYEKDIDPSGDGPYQENEQMKNTLCEKQPWTKQSVEEHMGEQERANQASSRRNASRIGRNHQRRE